MRPNLLLHDHSWSKILNSARLDFVFFGRRIQADQGRKKLRTELRVETSEKMSGFVSRATPMDRIFINPELNEEVLLPFEYLPVPDPRLEGSGGFGARS